MLYASGVECTDSVSCILSSDILKPVYDISGESSTS